MSTAFFRHAAKLATGVGAAQAITLASYTVLARLYTPEQFGALAVMLGLSTMLGAAASLRYDMTVLLPKTPAHARLAQFSAMLLAVVASLVVGGAMALLHVFGRFAWAQHWLEIAVAGLCTSLIQTCNFRQNREKRFSANAAVQAFRALAVFGFSALLYRQHDGLILGQVAGALCALAVCLLLLRRIDGRLLHRFGARRVLAWLHRHRRFMQYSFPAVFAGAFTAQLPLLLVAGLFGAQLAGYFSLIQRTVMAPVHLLSGAINNVYMQQLAERRARQQPVHPFVQGITRKMAGASLAVAAMFAAFCLSGGYALAFGQQWAEVDALAVVLTPVLAMAFVSKCVAGFAVLGRNELGLLYQCVLAAATALALWGAASWTADFRAVMAVYAATLTLAYAVQVASIHAVARGVDRNRSFDGRR